MTLPERKADTEAATSRAISDFLQSSAGPVHFGLGSAASASLIEIRWPSGIVQELKDVAADRVIR